MYAEQDLYSYHTTQKLPCLSVTVCRTNFIIWWDLYLQQFTTINEILLSQ